MTDHQQSNNSPFFVGEPPASHRVGTAPVADKSTEAGDVEQKYRTNSSWMLPEAPETLIEDSNAADVHEAIVEAHTDDPDSYEWYDIGTINGGGVYIGPSPADFVKSDDLQIAKRKNGQLVVRRAGSDAILEVRNVLKRPYHLSAKEAARFISQFSGYDSQGSKRKFSQSDIMDG